MFDNFFIAFDACLLHIDDSPSALAQFIAELRGIDDNTKQQLFRYMLVANFRKQRELGTVISILRQITVFAAFYDLTKDEKYRNKIVRLLIAAEIKTAAAAVDVIELLEDFPLENYPNLDRWIHRCILKYKAATCGRFSQKHEEIKDKILRPPNESIALQDGYTVETYIDSGGLKDVYRVVQRSTGQTIALKELQPRWSAPQYNDIYREALLQAKLQHQGVPNIFTLSEQDGKSPVFLERYINGTSWDKQIDEMPLSENIRVLLRTAEITAYAHRVCKIIHADLKPENVMLDQQFGEVYLTDWGLAVDMEKVKTPENEDGNQSVMGTRQYMPPEGYGLRRYAAPALDVFCLGGILYRVLTGKTPYDRDRSTPPPENIPLQTPKGETFPQELADIVLKALRSEPEERFADANEFADALKRYIERATVLLHYNRVKQQYQSRGKSPDIIPHVEIAKEYSSVLEQLTQLEGTPETTLNNVRQDLVEVSDKIQKIQRRTRRIKTVAAVLGTVAFVLLAVAVWFIIQDAEQKKSIALQNEEITKKEKDNAEKDKQLAIAAKEKANAARKLAETELRSKEEMIELLRKWQERVNGIVDSKKTNTAIDKELARCAVKEGDRAEDILGKTAILASRFRLCCIADPAKRRNELLANIFRSDDICVLVKGWEHQSQSTIFMSSRENYLWALATDLIEDIGGMIVTGWVNPKETVSFIQFGDIIYAINGQRTATLDDYKKAKKQDSNIVSLLRFNQFGEPEYIVKETGTLPKIFLDGINEPEQEKLVQEQRKAFYEAMENDPNVFPDLKKKWDTLRKQREEKEQLDKIKKELLDKFLDGLHQAYERLLDEAVRKGMEDGTIPKYSSGYE